MGDVGDMTAKVASLEQRASTCDERHEDVMEELKEIRKWNQEVYAELYVMKMGGRIAFVAVGAAIGYVIKVIVGG